MIKITNWEHLSFRVIALFVIAMFLSFIPETAFMKEFFNDSYCTVLYHNDSYVHRTPTFHWGWRHWLYFFMCMLLFIIQAVRIISFIDAKKFS